MHRWWLAAAVVVVVAVAVAGDPGRTLASSRTRTRKASTTRRHDRSRRMVMITDGARWTSVH